MSHLLNEHEAANYLGCSISLLRKRRLFGEGPAYCKIGRLVRYRQDDLAEFIAARVVTNNPGGK
jgi:hypothetical protein